MTDSSAGGGVEPEMVNEVVSRSKSVHLMIQKMKPKYRSIKRGSGDVINSLGDLWQPVCVWVVHTGLLI